MAASLQARLCLAHTQPPVSPLLTSLRSSSFVKMSSTTSYLNSLLKTDLVDLAETSNLSEYVPAQPMAMSTRVETRLVLWNGY